MPSVVKGKKGSERRMLLLGLDQSGKTSLLYRLKLGETVTVIPTIGFNVESLDDCVMWDVGGEQKIRSLWPHYFQTTNAIIFCVDLSTPDRHADAVKALCEQVLASAHLEKGCAIFICGTKTDLCTPSDLATSKRALTTLLDGAMAGRTYEFVTVSAHAGELSELQNVVLKGKKVPKSGGGNLGGWGKNQKKSPAAKNDDDDA